MKAQFSTGLQFHLHKRAGRRDRKPRNRCSIPGTGKRFFYLQHSVQSGHGADPASYTTGILGTSPVIKWLRCKCDHSRPSSPGFRLSGAISSFLHMPHGGHRKLYLTFSARQHYAKTTNVPNSLRCLLRSSETWSDTLTHYNPLSASDVPTSNAATKIFSFLVFTPSNTDSSTGSADNLWKERDHPTATSSACTMTKLQPFNSNTR